MAFEKVFTPLKEPVTNILDYPFSFIQDGSYDVSFMCKGFADDSEPVDAGDFPTNIESYYWIHEGTNDEGAWKCLCKLTNGFYAYYEASCDYTGFDCQGMMNIQLTKDAKKLYEYLVTTHIIHEILKEKYE
jgi:hypothetical protein